MQAQAITIPFFDFAFILRYRALTIGLCIIADNAGIYSAFLSRELPILQIADLPLTEVPEVCSLGGIS